MAEVPEGGGSDSKWTPRASTAGGGDHYKRAAMPTPPVEPVRTTRSASRLCGDGGTAGGGPETPRKGPNGKGNGIRYATTLRQKAFSQTDEVV